LANASSQATRIRKDRFREGGLMDKDKIETLTDIGKELVQLFNDMFDQLKRFDSVMRDINQEEENETNTGTKTTHKTK
jgi:site-specific DNA-adenine methylase